MCVDVDVVTAVYAGSVQGDESAFILFCHKYIHSNIYFVEAENKIYSE